MPTSAEVIFAWLQMLDELTYYELFGIEADATPDDVRSAFHLFCDAFHPDRHQFRSEEERTALSTIFKRGTEAYLVLVDAGFRTHYDAQLGAATRAGAPPRRVSFAPRSRPPSSQPNGAPKLEDSVRSPTARPFARRAEELIRAGDLRQAKLQLLMANHKDPDNEALRAALDDVEANLSTRRSP